METCRLVLVDVQLVLGTVKVEMFTEPFVKGRIDRLVALEPGGLPDFDGRNRQPNAGIPFFSPRQARRDYECVVAILFRRYAEELGRIIFARPIAFQATDRIAAPVNNFLSKIIFPLSVPSHTRELRSAIPGCQMGKCL